MKKGMFLVIGILSMVTINAQDINDALRYSNGGIIGSARYRALSGAFGALGGDLSAVSVNPASSAVFSSSMASVSLNVEGINNETSYFGGRNSSSDSDFGLNQGGAAFVFKNGNENSPWKKFALSIAYDNTKNYDDEWKAIGTNTKNAINGGSIASYFLNNANGLRLDEISAFEGETDTEAYSEIGSAYGVRNQQAFLGYASYIIESESADDDETNYYSNIEGNSFDQQYSYIATGYNGKIAFNFGTQYGEDLFLGINLNSHFLNYERVNSLSERNSTSGPVINDVFFENTLVTNGSGFSFQLGGIYKVSNAFRVGLTYDSPTWMTITEETTQSIRTRSNDGITYDDNSTFSASNVEPQVVNLFPDYTLQTPGKLTGSLAYVFGKKGLISFDFSTKNYGNTKFKPKSDPLFSEQNTTISNELTTASTYKIGGEYKVKQFSFRGGYRLEESPYKNGKTIGDLKGYSLGLGYNFGNTTLDLTYDGYRQNREHQLYSTGLTDSAVIENKNSNVTLTLGFQL